VSGQHAPWRASRDPLGSLGLEGNEQRRRRPARRGRRHGWHSSVDTAAVHAVGRPCRVRTRVHARVLGCARARGCDRLGFGPGVGCKTAERCRPWRSSSRCQRVAADKASAVGHRRVRVSARVGGKACTKHPEEGAPLPCSRVHEANLHGKAMAARRAGAHHRGMVQCKGKKKDQRPALDLPGRCACVRGARLREGACEITGVRACACRRLGHDGDRSDDARHGDPRNQETEQSGVGSGTCKRMLPSLARRPASPAAVARLRGGAVRA
jgi:hypothetical protein